MWSRLLLVCSLGTFGMACGIGERSAPASDPAPSVPSPPVPRAACSEGDRPEYALQGQVPQVERANGFQGFSCNLELVGQYQGEGAGWQSAWYEDCAYYGQANEEGVQSKGVVVVDVTDSANPTATAHLSADAMVDPWESLKVSEQAGLLAGVESNGPGFAIYDLKPDCTQPKLLAALDVSDAVGAPSGHAGGISPDGKTYYGTQILVSTYAIDIEEPTEPALIARVVSSPHDATVSEDGNRLYVSQPSVPGGTGNGLVIYDSTAIQSRLPQPQAPPLGALYWSDGSVAQHAFPVRLGGRPYVIFTDEQGALGVNGITAGKQGACDTNLPPNAMARIIDVAIESAPLQVSTLGLEVHDPANCDEILQDDDGEIFLYDSHYCAVDNVSEARMLACSYFESGLRVFDIRNPAAPKEIAYYNPPAPGVVLPGSQHSGTRDASWTAATPRFRLDRNEIWVTSQDQGLLILRFRRPIEEILGSGS